MHAVIQWLVDNKHQFEFEQVFHAALVAGRPVNVSVFEYDCSVLSNWRLVPGLVTKCKGDVAGFLMGLARNDRYTVGDRAVCLIAATGYAVGKDPVLPKGRIIEVAAALVSSAMSFAGASRKTEEFNALALSALSLQLNHPDVPMPVDRIQVSVKGKVCGKGRARVAQEALQTRAQDFLNDALRFAYYHPTKLLPPTREESPPSKEGIVTVEMAGAKVGRNDPCPCGSGLKYKKCCMDKAQEELKEAAGISEDRAKGFHEGKEHLLTADMLERMSVTDIERLDFAAVPDQVIEPLLDFLIRKQAVAGATQVFETLGYSERLEELYVRALRSAAKDNQQALLKRLAALVSAEELQSFQDCLHPRLALIAPAPEGQAAVIERQFKRELDDPVQLSNLAVGLMWWRMPALGLLTARAALATGPDAKRARALAHWMGEARERLGLPAEEPAAVLAVRIAERQEEEVASAEYAKELERRLQQVASGARKSDQRLEQLEKLLDDNQQELSRVRESAVAERREGIPEEELRRLNVELKGELRQVHEERNSLRKVSESYAAQLADMKAALKESGTAPAPDESGQEAQLAEEVSGSQPVRIPVFPKRFGGVLSCFPNPVRGDLMRVIGGMAAGDESAFLGTRRLKTRPAYYRQTVKKRYRVILKILPETLQVVDLMHRSDFERAVDRLR